jgi:photoprotection regulator FRP-like protein
MGNRQSLLLSRPGPPADLKWSAAEKTIARKAFDSALRRELETVLREAKDRAARIGQTSELWDLERWLTQRRQQIDRTYDYRYSVLPLVFGTLIREGRLSEQELHGLAEDKLACIRQLARP